MRSFASRSQLLWLTVISIGGFSSTSQAVIVLTPSSTSYSQNFGSLPTTGTSNAWANDTTLPGWFLFRQPAPGTAITAIAADNGGSTTGTFFSYGTTGSNERALGGVGSGGTYWGSPGNPAVAGWIAAAFTNDAGATITSFTLTFDGEQWRNGGNATPQTMALQYGFGATFGAVTWITPGGNFDVTSPTVGASAATLDGNAAANRLANRGGTITSLAWTTGSTLWVRWIENNDAGNDHGLAIDNFGISTVLTAVPEVSSVLMLSVAALTAIGFHSRVRRRN